MGERQSTGRVGGIAAVAVLIAGCGSGSSPVVRTGSSPPSSSTATPSGSASSPVRSSTPKISPGSQTVSVVPASGLDASQTVRVTAAGFTPGEALQVVECAAKGNATGPGDCNLTGMLAAYSDGRGRLTVQLRVLRGPFGSNKVICTATQPCLVSVTQASLSPTEEADAPISFR